MSEDTTPKKPVIVGKITPWFTKRMLLMLAMFVGFSAYFFYDWKVGYPKLKVITDTYLEYKVEMDALKAEGNIEAYNEKLNEWVELATKNEWEVKPEQNFKPELEVDDAKIAEQLYFGIGTGVIALVILGYFLFSLPKTLEVDDEAVKLPNGRRVPYSVIKKVDARRWGNKGLATIEYDDGAGLKGSAKIDGLKFGGFTKPEPYKADLILNRIIERFDGDLIELEEIEEENSEATESSGEDTTKRE